MILPTPAPKDYPTMTEEGLQFEVSFCLHSLTLLDRGGYNGDEDMIKSIRRLYEERLQLANNELERRYLLS